MKKRLLWVTMALFSSMFTFSQNRYDTISETLIVDRSVFPDFQLTDGPTQAQHDSLINSLRQNRSLRSLKEARPSRINNAQDKYYPPIFNQDGGSCSCAAMMGYNFTHEINALRDLNGKLEENQYPTHFNWFFSSFWWNILTQAQQHGVPNVPTYGGRTYSKLFGNQSNETKDFGWMQGYDKWYSAMFNRVDSYMEIGRLGDAETCEWLKNWLWNHCGDDDYHSGGVAYTCMAASGMNVQRIPAGSYEAGKQYIKHWGPAYDHAQTIVGYDDEIQIDLNENGSIEEDEIGAWIICNSWGNWGDNGLVYCPYKHARETYNPTTKTWGSWMSVQILKIRKNYAPKRTVKVSMNYTNRTEVKITMGASQDTTAQRPQTKVTYSHFNFAKAAGTGDHSGKIPMLGRWKDKLHEESMEFGLDVTDLSQLLDMTRPIKYFFTIETSIPSEGKGIVDYASLIDYEFDKNGIEMPFNESNVKILNKGRTVTLTVTVPGRPIYPPINFTIKGNDQNAVQLNWQAPVKSPFLLTGYKLYRNGKELVELTANDTQYIDNNSKESDNYTLTALYTYNETIYESEMSNRIVSPIQPENPTNNAINFDAGGFNINDLFDQPLENFTIEFWAKPDSVKSYNWHIGPGWGTFLFHFNGNKESGNIDVGYNTGNERIHEAGSIKSGEWTHIAVTNKKNTVSLYLNGKLVQNQTFSGRTGLNDIATFPVGRGSGDGIQGAIDEFRVWNTARTAKEIEQFYNIELADKCVLEQNLIAYYPMDTLADGRIRDAKGGYHASFINKVIRYINNCDSMQAMGSIDPSLYKADFTLPTNTEFMAGIPIEIKDVTLYGYSKITWDAPEAGMNSREILRPTLIYPQAGTYKVTMTASDEGGESKVIEREITIAALPRPIADFAPAYPFVTANSPISFKNMTIGDLCEYEWHFEGGTPEYSTNINAVTTYEKAGKYTVTLTARNASGEDVKVKEEVINVGAAVPVADFEANKFEATTNEPILLTDKSKNYPTSWIWIVENESIEQYTEKNPTIKFSKPGVYSISLVAINEAGKDSVSKEGYITITNQVAGNALNMDGNDDHVEVTELFTKEPVKAFTIEWWMYAKNNIDEGHQIGSNASTILMQSNAVGSLRVTLGGSKNVINAAASETSPLIEVGRWVHLAVVFDEGRVTIYRNGKEVTSKKFSGLTEIPAWTDGFFIGTNSNKTLNALIDEFRVWNVARTPIEIIENINAPLTNATEIEGLELYYDFDQSSGEVIDALGKHPGIRKNFGPDGDAWSISNAFNIGVDARKISVDNDDATNPMKATVNFIAGVGKKRVAFLKKTSENDGYPVDETKYTATSDLATTGSILPNSGYICVYNGNKETFTVEGLSPLTEYELMIVEYVDINRKPYYLKSSSHTTFTTGENTSEIILDITAQTNIYQTNETIEIVLPNDGEKHEASLYTNTGVLIEKSGKKEGEISISKAGLAAGIYLIRIDDSNQWIKVPVTK